MSRQLKGPSSLKQPSSPQQTTSSSRFCLEQKQKLKFSQHSREINRLPKFVLKVMTLFQLCDLLGSVTGHFRNLSLHSANTLADLQKSSLPVEQIVEQFPLLSVFPLSNTRYHVNQNFAVILFVYELQFGRLVEAGDILWWVCLFRAVTHAESYITCNRSQRIIQLLAGEHK